MISKLERTIAFRYLKPKKKEGFLKVISIFSFTGIALGVAILIIVMSVMNGFRTELINKILCFNPHIIVKSYDKEINENDIKKLSDIKEYISRTAFTYSGQGILINRNNTKGIIVRSYVEDDIDKINLIREGLVDGSLDSFTKNTVSIGKEMAISLDLVVGDEITLMSTSNLQTPIGNLPLQEKFKISSIFDTGFAEFDQNIIFIPFVNANSLFELTNMDIDLEIFLIHPERIDIAKKQVQKIFDDHYVYSWADLNKAFFGALKVERNVMFIILTLIIVVAAFNIISGLTILVKNKTKEIAILRTLGISKNSVAKIFFTVGFVIGFLATITGVIFGILFSYYIEEIRILITSIFNISLFPEEIYFLNKMPSELNFAYIAAISFFSLLIYSFRNITWYSMFHCIKNESSVYSRISNCYIKKI